MTKNDPKRLVLFDFDGTLTRRDSLFVFLRFFRGDWYFIRKILLALPGLIGYQLGMVDNSTAKEKLLAKFLQGTTVAEFTTRCRLMAQNMIPRMVNKPIFEKFQQHVVAGDEVVIVSASVEDWIIPWAGQWNVAVLATKLASDNGVLTGRFLGKNCNGEEKVTRIKSHLPLSDYDDVWAYGDSSGDTAMLSLASHVMYRGRVK